MASKTASFFVSALLLLATACATATIPGEDESLAPTNAAETDKSKAKLPAPASCGGGKSVCGTECIDLQTTATHCGSCENNCGGNSCVRGTCGSASSCGEGKNACDSKCVDLQTDANNCGACGHTCSGGAGGVGGACVTGACPGELRVRVLIDGQSQLVFGADKVKWHVVNAAAPGLWDGHHDATFLNTVPWTPAWPNNGDNRDCNCDSALSPPVTPLAKLPHNVTMKVVAGRGSVAISEQPSAANNFTLKVDFNDPPSGAAWFEVVLTYLSN